MLLQNVCVSQILLLPLHCDSRVWHVIYVTTLTLVKFCPWSVRCQRTCRIPSCYKGCRESSGESNCEKVCPLCRLGIVCRWYGSFSLIIIIVLCDTIYGSQSLCLYYCWPYTTGFRYQENIRMIQGSILYTKNEAIYVC